MLAPEFTPPVVTFADATGGTLRFGHTGEEVAFGDGSFVYVNFRGVARLQRPGLPVTDLGTWDEGDALVAAYWFAVTS